MKGLTRRDMLQAGASVVGVANLKDSHSTPEYCIGPTVNFRMVPDYMWGAPKRTSFLEAGLNGERLTLSGRILTTRCEPVAAARIEFYQTDPSGKYDYTMNFRLRGFQVTSNDGRYHLDTIMPGRYSEIRHIHYVIGAALKGAPGAVLLAHVVEFPTDEEAAKYPEEQNYGHSCRVLAAAMTREGDVLIAHHDIVLSI